LSGCKKQVQTIKILENKCDDGDCPYFEKLKQKAKEIEAVWCAERNEDEVISWQYITEIPCLYFEIIEDEEVYCIGIVFSINNLK
jgi:hypothetical protein